MPVFQCESCGCVENTALTGYWTRNRPNVTRAEDLGKCLCSACTHPTYPDGSNNPRAGKWHNRFKRQYLPLGEWIMNKETRTIYHKGTGATNYLDYCSDTPYE